MHIYFKDMWGERTVFWQARATFLSQESIFTEKKFFTMNKKYVFS